MDGAVHLLPFDCESKDEIRALGVSLLVIFLNIGCLILRTGGSLDRRQLREGYTLVQLERLRHRLGEDRRSRRRRPSCHLC